MSNNTEKRTVEVVMNGQQAGQTMKDMQKDLQILNNYIRGLTPGSEEFTKATEKWKDIKTTLTGLQKEAYGMQQAVDSMNQSAKDGEGAWSRIKETMLGVFSGEAVYEGIKKIGESLREFWNASKEDFIRLDQANVKQTAVLNAMGSSAAMTKKELKDLTEEIENNTLFTKVQTKEAENVLLTYDKIGRDIFPQVMKSAADMAGIMGMDLTGAVKTLAKALESPEHAMMALKRAGIALAPELEMMMMKMAKSGDIAGAQSMLLNELQKRYGGVAKAAYDAGSAMDVKLDKALESIRENLGAIIVKGIGPFITGFADMINSVNNFLFPAKKQADIMEEERINLIATIDQIKNYKIGSQDRKNMIDELNRQYPDFLQNLDAEKVTNEQLRDRLKEVNEQMLNKIVVQKVQDELDEKLKKAGEYKLTAIRAEKEAYKDLENGISSYYKVTARQFAGAVGVISESEKKQADALHNYAIFIKVHKDAGEDLLTLQKNLSEYEDKNNIAWSMRLSMSGSIEKYNNAIERYNKESNISNKLAEERDKISKELHVDLGDGKKSNSPNFTPELTDAQKAKIKAEQDRIKAQQLKDLADTNAKISDLNNQLILDKEHQDLDAEDRRHARLVEEINKEQVSQEKKDEALALAEQVHQKNISAIEDKYFKERADNEYNKSIAAAQERHDKELMLLQDQFSKGQISQEEYQQKLVELQEKLLREKIQIAKDYAKSETDLNKELLQVQVDQHQKELDANARKNKELLKQDKKSLKDRISDIKDFASSAINVLDKINSIQKNQEDAALEKDRTANDEKKKNLEQRYERGLITKDQYDKQVAAMDAELDKKDKKMKHDQAVRDRDLAVFKALIDVAAGEVKALAEQNYVAAALIGVVGAAEIAEIESRPIPEYDAGGPVRVLGGNTGKMYDATYAGRLKGGYYSSPTLALISENKGEYVISNKMLEHPYIANQLPMMEAIRVGKMLDSGGWTSSVAGPSPSPSGEGRGEARRGGSSHAVLAALQRSSQVNDKLLAVLDSGIVARMHFNTFEKQEASVSDIRAKAGLSLI